MEDWKMCSHCKELYPVSEFYKETSKPSGLQSHCKYCKRDLQAERRKTVYAKITEFLQTQVCCDCGTLDTRVFEFDHVSGQKIKSIAELKKHGNWDKVWKEIQKCEVVCANCHRIRTFTRMGNCYRLNPEVAI